MVDVKVAEAFAQGRIPTNSTYEYITEEYLSQSRDAPARIAIILITVLVTVIVALRCYSRTILVKSFGLDDWLALFSYVCFIAFVALCIVLIDQGSGRHIEYIQYVLTAEETDSTEVNDYAAHLIYTSALFVCRLSGLAFFHRLCSLHDTLLRTIQGAMVFLVCAFLPQFFLILLHCTPITGLWPYAWQSNVGEYKCITWGTVYVTNSGLSLVCDLVIFAIPVAMINLLRLSRGRKIMLASVLMPGVVVIGISAARLYLCVVGQWRADGSWYYDPQLVIEVAEIGGTLVALSVPGLKPLFREVKIITGSTLQRTDIPWERREPRAGAGPRRRSGWNGGSEPSTLKTSINADSSTYQGSSRASDEHSWSRNITVQMEVDQRSMPLNSGSEV